MKTLFLLRHAKSTRDDPSIEDHERPLNARGHDDAKAIGQHIKDAGYAPALVMCSTAQRTQETYGHIAPFLGGAKLILERELYLASATRLLRHIRAAPEDAASLMLIGHNPGIESLALLLTRQAAAGAQSSLRREMGEKFPTGSLAVLDLRASRWAAVTPGSATLRAFTRPRDLA